MRGSSFRRRRLWISSPRGAAQVSGLRPKLAAHLSGSRAGLITRAVLGMGVTLSLPMCTHSFLQPLGVELGHVHRGSSITLRIGEHEVGAPDVEGGEHGYCR